MNEPSRLQTDHCIAIISDLRSGSARRPLELERTLRMYFMQQWFNLSDPRAEDALYDSESCGASPASSWMTM